MISDLKISTKKRFRNSLFRDNVLKKRRIIKKHFCDNLWFILITTQCKSQKHTWFDLIIHVVDPVKYRQFTIFFLSQQTNYNSPFIKITDLKNHIYGEKMPVNIILYAEHFINFSSVYGHAAPETITNKFQY